MYANKSIEISIHHHWSLCNVLCTYKYYQTSHWSSATLRKQEYSMCQLNPEGYVYKLMNKLKYREETNNEFQSVQAFIIVYCFIVEKWFFFTATRWTQFQKYLYELMEMINVYTLPLKPILRFIWRFIRANMTQYRLIKRPIFSRWEIAHTKKTHCKWIFSIYYVYCLPLFL